MRYKNCSIILQRGKQKSVKEERYSSVAEIHPGYSTIPGVQAVEGPQNWQAEIINKTRLRNVLYIKNQWLNWK